MSNYLIDVSMMTGQGLDREVFKNETSFSEGRPDEMVVDEQLSFNTVLNEDDLFSYSRWSGYLSFPHTSIFDFEVAGAETSCRLWIEDELVVDTEEDFGTFRASGNVLYEIKVECSLTVRKGILLHSFSPPSPVVSSCASLTAIYQDANLLVLQLFWSSRQMSRQIVPKQHFHRAAEPIRGSPFHLTVTA